MVFELNYQKNNNEKLFKDLEKFLEIEYSQNYIPIYTRYFQLNETNYKNINLNHSFYLNEILKDLNETNSYECSLKNTNDEIVSREVFFKFSPLLDPVKYMLGKYDITNENLLQLPDFMNKNSHAKSRDTNNSAYVDGYFTYLTSQLLNHHGFVNGLDYYGSFLGTKKNFIVNVIDDLEYLSESEFFNNNKEQLFTIDYEEQSKIFNFDSRNNKKRLFIDDDNNNDTIITLDDIEKLEDINNLFHTSNETEINVVGEHDLIYENELIVSKNDTKVSNSTCSSRTSNTDNSDNDNSDNDNSDNDNSDNDNSDNDNSDNDNDNSHSDNSSEGDSNDEDNSNSDEINSISESDDVVNAKINKFPVNIICLEKCSSTLDDLMVSNELSTKEWCAILMQIIMILITYQKCFNFTHNDLHTNNIMYIETEKEFLYYKFNNKYYKVPTYKRIIKIIDFGRSIYKFKGVSVCSDSFHKKGDAATQYNFEPYMNENKPRLEPNYSFDLCRLACSIYDFLITDENVNRTPITSLINEWCKDDKGRNILYKTNGEERYPDFKLYKMIVRSVHEHTPQNQLKRELFSQFLIPKNKLSKVKKIINIDDIPVYI